MAKKKKLSNRLQQIGSTGSRMPSPPMPGRSSDAQLVELGMFVSATVFGTLILAILAVIFGLKAIENHLETEATALINHQVAADTEVDPTVARRTDVSVDASATDLHLRGTVGLEEYEEILPALVQGIEGVHNVSVELEYVPPVAESTPDVVAGPITVTWANGSATIVGEVSNEANRLIAFAN